MCMGRAEMDRPEGKWRGHKGNVRRDRHVGHIHLNLSRDAPPYRVESCIHFALADCHIHSVSTLARSAHGTCHAPPRLWS